MKKIKNAILKDVHKDIRDIVKNEMKTFPEKVQLKFI